MYSKKHQSAALTLMLSLITPNVLATEKVIETIEVEGNRLTKTTGATGMSLTVKETPQSISLIDRGMDFPHFTRQFLTQKNTLPQI
jgi:outer membrane receptor for ferric coprogen and ferric-rhodotorulic acid